MTLIEFFDKTPACNIIAALALRPRRIVYIGTDRQKISSLMPHIRKILAARGMKTALTMRIIEENDLSGVLSVLRELVSREDEFVFDFTGGDEASLVALGMVFQLRDRKTGVFQMDCDTRQGMLYKIPLDGNGTFEAIPYDGAAGENPVQLTLEEGIMLHRGQVKEEMIRTNTAAGEPFTMDTYDSLNRLWRICQSDCGYWNGQIGKMGAALRPTQEDKMVYTLAYSMRGLDERFLGSLTDGKFIRLEETGGKFWRCTFADRYVKDCLMKAGTILEYKTYMTALYYDDGKAPSPYTNGGAGVVIDWKELAHEQKNPGRKSTGNHRYTDKSVRSPQPIVTRNEIDSLLMRGVTPVFVSCKNGEVASDELYKLSTVAGRFGNRYARRALVATVYFDKDDRNYAGDGAVNYLRSRAKDMRIKLIECAHHMTDAQLARALWEIDEGI